MIKTHEIARLNRENRLRKELRDITGFQFATDIELEWFDCTVSFTCPCGENEIFMDGSDGEPYKCKCGKVYKFICRVEVKDDN